MTILLNNTYKTFNFYHGFFLFIRITFVNCQRYFNRLNDLKLPGYSNKKNFIISKNEKNHSLYHPININKSGNGTGLLVAY